MPVAEPIRQPCQVRAHTKLFLFALSEIDQLLHSKKTQPAEGRRHSPHQAVPVRALGDQPVAVRLEERLPRKYVVTFLTKLFQVPVALLVLSLE